MTSSIVVLVASILHFGLRGSCFLSTDKFAKVPGTVYAGHIAYCALLHFLYDMDLVAPHYKRRMCWLATFLIELVLGIAIMEVCGLWLWSNVEHICHRVVQQLLQHCGMSVEFYHEWEWAFMGVLMSTLAILLWMSAFDATNPRIATKHQPKTKQPEHPEQPEQPEQPAQPEQSEKPEQPGQPQQPEQPEKAEQPQQAQQAEQPQQAQQVEVTHCARANRFAF